MLTLLHQIADKVGADVDHHPHVKVMQQPTEPERVVEQIEGIAINDNKGSTTSR